MHGVGELLHSSLRGGGGGGGGVVLGSVVMLAFVWSRLRQDHQHEGIVRAATKCGDVLVLITVDHARACSVVDDHALLADGELDGSLGTITSCVFLV